MKAVILAAGFGTRLQRDLENDTSGQHSHLVGVPKPLLPIGDRPLVSHWIAKLKNLPEIDQTFVVTNGGNHEAFEEWQKTCPRVKLICDGALSNEARSGAVSCMNEAVMKGQIQEDILIIAGDTLFFDDFKLNDIIQQHKEFKKTNENANMLVYVTCTDEEVHKYGILELDSNSRVTNFLEKPSPEETPSRKECPCFYIFNKNSLHCLSDFLDDMKDQPLKAKDATGNFIAYLYKKEPVYATEISGRFDVGGLPSYLVCHQHFMNETS